jgi:hypothetical protein
MFLQIEYFSCKAVLHQALRQSILQSVTNQMAVSLWFGGFRCVSQACPVWDLEFVIWNFKNWPSSSQAYSFQCSIRG